MIGVYERDFSQLRLPANARCEARAARRSLAKVDAMLRESSRANAMLDRLDQPTVC
jgi:hypothetical protein